MTKKGKEMTERKRSYNFFKGRKPGCLEMVYTKLSWSVQNKCLEKDKLEQTERNMRRKENGKKIYPFLSPSNPGCSVRTQLHVLS